MAAVLSPKAFSFPHNILQDNRGPTLVTRLEKMSTPRPSLPPITSLIHGLDMRGEKAPLRSPALEQYRRGSPVSQPPTPDRISFSGSPHSRLTVSPSLPGTSSFDFTTKPERGSSSPTIGQFPSQGRFEPSPSSTNPESGATQHWSILDSPASSRRTSEQPTPSQSQPSIRSQSSYLDLMDSTRALGSLIQQRPLPSNFPPVVPVAGQQLSPIDSSMSNPQYQHHHHYSASSSPNYSPSTDRYQCPTCQKAFSRPSSLKIHTYSHTGEKPFKCKHDGCGKYFSVRSNMKRHEKGCHGVETSSSDGNSPKPM